MLSFLGDLANSDFTPTTEIGDVSQGEVKAGSIDIVDRVFSKAFQQLEDNQRRVLIAVALFDRDAPLGALYYVSVYIYKLLVKPGFHTCVSRTHNNAR